MKKTLVLAVLVAALFLIAVPAFAQDGEAAPATNWVAITSGFTMAISSFGCGIAQSRAAAAAMEGMARNPGAAAPIRFGLILSLVFIETLVLLTFVIVFVKVA